MQQIRLGRAPHRPMPALPVAGDMALNLGRAHEFCGPARRTLALRVMARTSGPVIWIRPGWMAERINPDGVQPLVDPGRLIFVDVPRAADLLWCAEESLRAGAVALVVAELPEPPPLTPVRRLHLAAEAGAETAPQPPLCLLLCPGDGGAAGVESRWFLSGAHASGSRAWQLERRRDRTAPPAAWQWPAKGDLKPVETATHRR